MRIKFSPQRRDDRLEVVKHGDVLTINGRAFDFGPVPEGATLPASAVDCEFFVGDIERIDGALHLTLLLPHGPNPSQNVAFPAPLTVLDDGPVAMPFDPSPQGDAQ